jgi:hypothetical protein
VQTPDFTCRGTFYRLFDRSQTTMKQLETLGERSPFLYEWTHDNKIKIRYGTDFKTTYYFDGVNYDSLIQNYRGKEVRINLHATEDSIQKWIVQETKKETRIAQCVAPILCWENHARNGIKSGRILFL